MIVPTMISHYNNCVHDRCPHYDKVPLLHDRCLRYDKAFMLYDHYPHYEGTHAMRSL